MPPQSTAQRRIGFSFVKRMMRRADSGSTISLAGTTRASHSGVPSGGVTSASNTAILSGFSPAPTAGFNDTMNSNDINQRMIIDRPPNQRGSAANPGDRATRNPRGAPGSPLGLRLQLFFRSA